MFWLVLAGRRLPQVSYAVWGCSAQQENAHSACRDEDGAGKINLHLLVQRLLSFFQVLQRRGVALETQW